MEQIRLIAMDLDGTLTQHRTPLSEEYAQILTRLSEKYRLLMVGAGMCGRIFRQMNGFPIDILGNYGMQFATYNPETKGQDIVTDEVRPCDRESVDVRVRQLREQYGFTRYAGEHVEYHSSGCVTIPLLGTAAKLEDKLSFDPTRKIRRSFYAEVKALFPEYTVFIGGSSSFDMAPRPFDKAYALGLYCAENGFAHNEVAYIGDDYGPGGNDESVYKADFHYITIDDYRDFPKIAAQFL